VIKTREGENLRAYGRRKNETRRAPRVVNRDKLAEEMGAAPRLSRFRRFPLFLVQTIWPRHEIRRLIVCLALLILTLPQPGGAEPAAPQPSLRIATRAAGFYRVRYDDLLAAGMQPSTIDPRHIRITNRRTEVAIRFLGEEDGRLDPGDAVLFYAAAYSDRFTNDNVYWLSVGASPGKRMAQADSTPKGAPLAASFRAATHAEADTVYWQAMPGATEDDRWFWGGRLGPPGQGVATERDYSVVLGSPPASGGQAGLKVRLKGYTTLAHRTRLLLNGVVVDERTWQGQGVFDQSVDVPQSLLKAGANTVRVQAVDSGASVDQFLVNWIEINSDALFRASGDELAFGSTTSGSQQCAVAGFAAPSIDAFDISDPSAPIRLTGGQVEGGAGDYRLRFEQPASAGTRYLVLTAAAWRAPLGIVADTPSQLVSAGNSADYIVITPGDFWQSAQALAAHRAGQGFRTAVVDVQDIYDEFNAGIFSPVAIGDFIRYAYLTWQRPAPAYVVLLGDAYQDYKDNLHTGTRNFVPSYSFGSTLFGEVSSDNWLAAVDGGDVLPDVHLGRLAAQSAEEAGQMVAKVIAYDQQALKTPADALLLVADDDQPDFEQLSDSLAGFAPARKIYAAAYPPGNPTDDILAAINSGTGFVNYAGHGEHNAWGRWQDNTRSIFTLADAARLENAGRLPVVTVGDCLNGFFTGPRDNPSLAEAFQRQLAGGAIAVWAPTGYGYPEGHRLLLEGFYRAMFSQGITRLGPATTAAKAAAYANTPFWGELIMTYVLFGDPATQVPLKNPAIYLPSIRR
jgi:hypothetical protein